MWDNTLACWEFGRENWNPVFFSVMIGASLRRYSSYDAPALATPRRTLRMIMPAARVELIVVSIPTFGLEFRSATSSSISALLVAAQKSQDIPQTKTKARMTPLVTRSSPASSLHCPLNVAVPSTSPTFASRLLTEESTAREKNELPPATFLHIRAENLSITGFEELK